MALMCWVFTGLSEVRAQKKDNQELQARLGGEGLMARDNHY